MDNYELAAKFRGRTDGLQIVYGDEPPTDTLNNYRSGLTTEDRIAFAYIRDVGELCSVIEVIPDKEGELESAIQLCRFYEALLCPCECNDEDPSVTVTQNEDGKGWTAQCNKCQSEFVVGLNPNKK